MNEDVKNAQPPSDSAAEVHAEWKRAKVERALKAADREGAHRTPLGSLMKKFGVER